MEHQEFEKRKELYRSINTAGQGAIKSALLLNGAAAVAILAFISNLQEDPGKVAEIAFCLIIFGGGAFVATAASGITYLCVFFNGISVESDFVGRSNRFLVLAERLNYASIFLVIISYMAFLAGLFVVYRNFSTY